MTVDELIARAEIHQCLLRYCRGVDRGDKALVASAYHDDGYDDHGTFKGLGRDFAGHIVDRMDTTGTVGMHQITNSYVEVDGDKAVGETYFIAVNPEGPDMVKTPGVRFVYGRYFDRFEKRAGEWKIARRQVLIDWAQPNDDGTPWPRMPAFSQGLRQAQGQDATAGAFKVDGKPYPSAG